MYLENMKNLQFIKGENLWKEKLEFWWQSLV